MLFRSLHKANYIYKGMKFDIYDGGHRVPFVVRWPGVVAPGTQSASLVCLTDIMATLAEVTGRQLPRTAAEDSFSMLPILKNYSKTVRRSVIHHSGYGMFAFRDGQWKFVDGYGSGGNEKLPETPYCELGQLYDIVADPEESRNVACDNPKVVARMKQELYRQVEQGYTRKL